MNLTQEQTANIVATIDVLELIQLDYLRKARQGEVKSKVAFKEIQEILDTQMKLEALYKKFPVLELVTEAPSAPVVTEVLEEIKEDFGKLIDAVPPKTDGKFVGRFDRKLFGGIIDPEGSSIFLPESIAVRLNAENGDIVQAQQSGFMDDGSTPRYTFSVVTKQPMPSSRREAITTLEADENANYFAMTNHGRVNITQYDMEKMNAKLGDAITLAYYSDHLGAQGRILKVHVDNQIIALTEKSKRTVASGKKHEKDEEIVVKSLLGLKICVIGGEGVEANYRKTLEELGAKLLWVDGNANMKTLEKSIKKCDGTIFVTDSLSHPTYWSAKEIAEKHKVPYQYAPSTGISGLRYTAVDKLLPMIDSKRLQQEVTA